MINPKYLIYHDLIGIYALAKPLSKLDRKFIPIGIIIDETQHMLITENGNKIKKYIKRDYIFRFKIPEEEDLYLEVPGNKIIGLPLNRLRSLKKKRWLRNE
jgi:RNase P/RNase MRP subunit p29